MKKINFITAIREAQIEEMDRDESVIILGEDVAAAGGPFGCTKGILDKFGENRAFDTPLSECAIIGTSIGSAAFGFRPVTEIMFMDFVMAGGAMGQIVNQMAKLPFLGDFQIKLPIVVRMPIGTRHPVISMGAHHGQSLEAWFMHTPGLKVAIPSNAYEAKGLLKTAIRDDNPVIFLEHKIMYFSSSKKLKDYKIDSEIPDDEYTIPFGKANVVKKGKDLTVVATMFMLHKAIKVSNELEKAGISLEIIDPRTLVPFDYKTIVKSVEKTKKLLVVSEDCITGGVASEICSRVAEVDFGFPIRVSRVSSKDIPYLYSPAYEEFILPNEEDIKNKILRILK